MGQGEEFMDRLFTNLPPEVKEWAIKQVMEDGASWMGCSDQQIIAEYQKSLEPKPLAPKEVPDKPKSKKTKKKTNVKKKKSDNTEPLMLGYGIMPGDALNDYSPLTLDSSAGANPAANSYDLIPILRNLLLGLLIIFFTAVILTSTTEKEFLFKTAGVIPIDLRMRYPDRIEGLRLAIDEKSETDATNLILIESHPDKVKVVLRSDGNKNCSVKVRLTVWRRLFKQYSYIKNPEEVILLLPNVDEFKAWQTEIKKLQENYKQYLEYVEKTKQEETK